MKEYYYEKLLNIKTQEGKKGIHKSIHYHPYEPTPYSALEELFEQYKVTKDDRIVDFGSGKGRLNFFIHHLFGAHVTGIEMNEFFYRDSLANLERYLVKHKNSKNKIQFFHCLAEDYPIHPEDNRFYFFNPFSIHIFKKILSNIMLSMEQHPREVELVFYYPAEDYIYFLENQTPFELKQEFRLSFLYEHNSNERFLVYRYPFF
ncbi:class I SAM-dependent methyltransferase [Mesobacillus maritimus]|uniref:class I SAM-dependent methyltransferase n=1 Tax=Mesobacillus maritimus TaxID=1643336 RepID=UPI00204149DB|nr:class I SAM-dependent methyltransferase [Mesobacillus maritimus]MCM3669723.1 class I SAM-dependent methyltransferase [Mesobacillus maritimus]